MTPTLRLSIRQHTYSSDVFNILPTITNYKYFMPAKKIETIFGLSGVFALFHWNFSLKEIVIFYFISLLSLFVAAQSV